MHSRPISTLFFSTIRQMLGNNINNKTCGQGIGSLHTNVDTNDYLITKRFKISCATGPCLHIPKIYAFNNISRCMRPDTSRTGLSVRARKPELVTRSYKRSQPGTETRRNLIRFVGCRKKSSTTCSIHRIDKLRTCIQG